MWSTLLFDETDEKKLESLNNAYLCSTTSNASTYTLWSEIFRDWKRTKHLIWIRRDDGILAVLVWLPSRLGKGIHLYVFPLAILRGKGEKLALSPLYWVRRGHEKRTHVYWTLSRGNSWRYNISTSFHLGTIWNTVSKAYSIWFCWNDQDRGGWRNYWKTG